MKRKIFALITGLVFILAAPAFIASCGNKEKKDNVEQIEQATPGETNQGQLAYAYAQPDNRPVFILTQDEVPAAEDPEEGSSALWLTISGVANLVLLLLTTFATNLWTRARSTLKAISDGLADGNLTTSEIKAIVNAWKNG